MFTSRDLNGLMAMMPAFATEDANDIRATSTIAVDNLRAGVNRMIGDGADVITTTGSFGECHTLFWDEFETIIRAAIEVVNQRVPLFLGCTSVHTRETVRKMEFVRDNGGQGVLVGVPYYEPATFDNIVKFYYDIGEAFPDLSIMIYHNPHNHKVHIPVEAIRKINEFPNVVAMKDSHRTPLEFMKLMDITKGKISVFVNQAQLYPYALLGAAGCWSIDAWMGPWPVLRLRNAIREGDYETAEAVIKDLTGGGGIRGEGSSKLNIHYAGYCEPGPERPPFRAITEATHEASKKKAAYWNRLSEKYRPQVQVMAAV